MSSINIDNSSDEISLKELVLKLRLWWKYLLSKWLVIIVSGILGGAFGLYYAIVKKPIYTATTTFVLEDEKGGGGLGGLAGLASMAGLDLGSGGGIFQGDNILGLYKSRSILEQTLLTEITNEEGKKELLVDRYVEANHLRELWAKKPELANLKFRGDSLEEAVKLNKTNRLRDSILGVIVIDLNNNNLYVDKPDKKLSVIQVSVKSQDEFFAKTFNDQLVKKVSEFYISTKTKKTMQNVQILQHKTDSVRAVMNGAIYTAVEVADATPNLNPTRQVQRVAPAQRAQFSAETNKSILAEMVKNLEMSKIALLRETPLIQLIDQPIYPLKMDKYGKAKTTILGGLFFSFMVVLFLSIKLFLKNMFSE